MNSSGIPSGTTTQVICLTEEDNVNTQEDLKPQTPLTTSPVVRANIPPAVITAPPEAPDNGLMAQFIKQPGQFSFDAAVLLMLRDRKNAPIQSTIRFHSPQGTAYPTTDITAIQKNDTTFHTTVTPIGLTGPTGVLPLHYTMELTAEHRRRASALSDFFELLIQRPLIHYAESGIKYRLASGHTLPENSGSAPYAAQISKVLLAIAGFQSSATARSLGVNADTVKFYSGYFSSMPRSTECLRSLLSDWLKLPVRIEEFTPLRIKIERDQQSRLPVTGYSREDLNNFSQLGVNATIGERYLNYQSQFTMWIGPLDLTTFQSLIPTGQLFKKIINMSKAYTGPELQIIIRPILKKTGVPALRLPAKINTDNEFQPRLGWNSWLTPAKPRTKDVSDAIFTE